MPGCLCAWYERCDHRPDPAEPYIRSLEIRGQEIGRQMGEAMARRIDNDLLALFNRTENPDMWFGPVGNTRPTTPNRTYTVQVNIPTGSATPVYRAFLEMMWRVSRLAKLPPNAVWAVEVIPSYAETSDEVLAALGPTPFRVHRLTGTWSPDGPLAHDTAEGC